MHATSGVVSRILQVNEAENGNKAIGIARAYSGDTNWEDWAFLFENVAAVNKWTAEQKMKWLKVLFFNKNT